MDVAEYVPLDGVFADASSRDAMALAATVENQSQVDGGRRPKFAVTLWQPYDELACRARYTPVSHQPQFNRDTHQHADFSAWKTCQESNFPDRAKMRVLRDGRKESRKFGV